MTEALTFDCYGTLVDWRGGLLAGVRACPAATGGWSEEDFLADRLREETRLEASGWRPYREIVALSVQAALAHQGVALPDDQATAVAEGIGAWPPFSDTRKALARLGRGRRLAIVSNVDRQDIETTVAALGVDFAVIVTAEDVRSYKPATAHFEEVLRRLDLPRERVLHVAQSLYHDIRPASALGIETAWVNRLGEDLPDDLKPHRVVPDLAALAKELGPAA